MSQPGLGKFVIVRYLVKDRQEEKSPRVRPMVPA